jgi:hypothetical protein
MKAPPATLLHCSETECVRVARRVPERKDVDGAGFFINRVNDPVLGAAPHAEQVAAIRRAREREIRPGERRFCEMSVQDTIEPFDLLDRELLAVGTQVKGELIDFALCEWVRS